MILLSSPLICLICLICLISFLVQILWCDLILKVCCTSVSSITIAFLWNVAHRFSLAFAEFFKELFCYSSVRPFKYGLFVQENLDLQIKDAAFGLKQDITACVITMAGILRSGLDMNESRISTKEIWYSLHLIRLRPSR